MTSAPRLTPSSLNWTPTTPMLSVAFAATVRVPEIVAPAVGVMMEAAGGVMSVNVAVTVVAALRVTGQAPGPEQPPPVQPPKVAAPVGLRGRVAAGVGVMKGAGGGVGGGKVGVTGGGALGVRGQARGPEQPPPLQPLTVEPPAGAAVSVTAVPLAKLAAQVAPQVMPAGLLVTVPAPVPALETVSVKVCRVKVAVTVVAAESVTVQAPVPEQPPPVQPPKVEPAAGAAVSVTAVPLAKLAAQVAPQVMPAGLLVTVPVPAPAGVTVNTKVGTKVAVTVVAAEIVTVQAPVPVQPPPLQPVKVEPAAGAAGGGPAGPPREPAGAGAPPAVAARGRGDGAAPG